MGATGKHSLGETRKKTHDRWSWFRAWGTGSLLSSLAFGCPGLFISLFVGRVLFVQPMKREAKTRTILSNASETSPTHALFLPFFWCVGRLKASWARCCRSFSLSSD